MIKAARRIMDFDIDIGDQQVDFAIELDAVLGGLQGHVVRVPESEDRVHMEADLRRRLSRCRRDGRSCGHVVGGGLHIKLDAGQHRMERRAFDDTIGVIVSRAGRDDALVGSGGYPAGECGIEGGRRRYWVGIFVDRSFFP